VHACVDRLAASDRSVRPLSSRDCGIRERESSLTPLDAVPATHERPLAYSATAMDLGGGIMRRLLLLVLLLLVAPVAAARGQAGKTYQVGRIRTRLGEILFVLSDETPRHKTSFLRLAASHYWDSLTFNRVIANFVAQGGCPDTPEGFGGSPYLVAPEFRPELRHVYGAVAAGRDNNPGQLSAGCQFYIVVNKQGLPRLDDHYTVYGQVFKGMDVVEAIVHVPTDSTNKPFTPIPLHVDVITMTADELKADGFVAH
jgi:peptidyl-prolyl cis-trans isomerase B (cyclophilin B)